MQDVLTNQSEEVECSEPMGVTAEHHAHSSTAKQIDKPRKKLKQRHPTRTHERTAEYQLLDSPDCDTDVPLQIAQPAAVKDESGTVKWDTGKASTEKTEKQQPGQPMATTNCAPASQCLSC